MKRDYGGVVSVAKRADAMLQAMRNEIEQQRSEFNLNEYYQTYTRNGAANLPKLSRRAVEQAITEMESAGYQFGKKKVGNVEQYALSILNVIDLYAHRGVPKYREAHEGPFVIYIVNLKGGVAKTVSTVTLAHGLRVHPELLRHDLRILVVDLDPQASGTMFLNHTSSIGSVTATAAQAMLNDLDADQLRKEVIKPTIIPGVDVIPASIDDGFISSEWKDLVSEHLPGMNPFSVLRTTIIDRLADDYDFIFLDTGPHLDDFMMNALAASDILFTPTPPAQVDYHSTLKYLTRLPDMLERLEQNGIEPRLKANVGFMSKVVPNLTGKNGKKDHETSQSMAREVYSRYMLDSTLPRLDGFERCGESFDTVISANPLSYAGAQDSLKRAKNEAERFTLAVFDRIEYVRKEE